jgi:hypothetical protein
MQMRRMTGWALALVLACAGAQAMASDDEVTAQIAAAGRADFASGNFKALEDRYAAALATSSRTPSGLFVANVIRSTIVPEPDGESQVPGRDDHWVPIEHKLEDWAAKFPKSSLVAVAQGEALIGHAWSWRGGGYARTVPPGAFKKVDLYAKRAFDAMMAREEAGRKDPYWYTQMLVIARIQSWNREDTFALFRKATDAFPLNYDIYFTLATQLAPRWGGSQEEIAKLAAFAVERTRDVEGESLYARVYWSVASQLDADFGGPEVDWKRIRTGFDDVIKRYPDRWNLNNYARFACDARDLPAAKNVLLQIKGDVDPKAWRGRANYLRCVQAAGLTREQLQ